MFCDPETGDVPPSLYLLARITVPGNCIHVGQNRLINIFGIRYMLDMMPTN